MAIEFECPSCRELLRMEDDAAGRMARCGNCMSVLRVPVSPPPAAPPPAASPRPTVEPVEPPQAPTHTDDHASERPRPRRQVLLWIMLPIVLLGFLTCAGCAGLLFMLQPKWRAHASPEGGYRVDYPAAPRHDIHELLKFKEKAADKVRLEGTLLFPEFQTEAYEVIYFDLDPLTRTVRTDEEILTDAVQGLRGGHAMAEVLQETPVKVSGFPAKELVISYPEGVICVARVVIADTRMYVVVAGGHKGSADNPRFRRFLDSFEVTDPKLLKRANPVGNKD